MHATATGPVSPSSSVHHAPASTREWFSPTQAAWAVGVGRRTIYAAIRDGSLKAAKVNGRDLRVAAAWLSEWMERRSSRA